MSLLLVGALTPTRFERIRELGSGAMGVVYLVRDTEGGGALYAEKVINSSTLDAAGRASALAEVDVLSRLSHPAICGYHGSFESGGGGESGSPKKLHILLEHCDGGDLDSAIRTMREASKSFDEPTILRMFAQLACALLHVHSAGILHRDLKASNVFVTGSGSLLKLADFGIARSLSSEASMASTVIGTPVRRGHGG